MYRNYKKLGEDGGSKEQQQVVALYSVAKAYTYCS